MRVVKNSVEGKGGGCGGGRGNHIQSAEHLAQMKLTAADRTAAAAAAAAAATFIARYFLT